MDDKIENFEENFFFAKIASGEVLFLPLVKAKNKHQNFEKTPETKRCAIRRLNVPNFCASFLFQVFFKIFMLIFGLY